MEAIKQVCEDPEPVEHGYMDLTPEARGIVDLHRSFKHAMATGDYDGELLTRTSWEVERTLNANPVSDWKGYVRYEGVHLFGFVDPAPDALYTVFPNSGGVRLQRRSSRLEVRTDQTSTSTPGLRQTGSLMLGTAATDGFVLIDTFNVANPAQVRHMFTDAWWHLEYTRPRAGRERWTWGGGRPRC